MTSQPAIPFAQSDAVDAPEVAVASEPHVLTPEPWDPTHSRGADDEWYSRDNVGEAMPGVATPLTWSLWGPIGELNARTAAFNLGVLSRKEADVPADAADRYVQAFYGRIAMRARLLATIGDRMPGVTGADVVRGIFAEAPSDMSYRPTMRRYPFIAARMPVVFLRTPGRIRALAAGTDAWWRGEIDALPGRDRAAATAALATARERFAESLVLHSTGLVGVVQPLYHALENLVTRTGVGDVGVFGGTGGAEMAIVDDIWRASRDELSLEQLLRSHGFHGPSEGELSARVWREDPEPIERVIAEYARRDAGHEPARKAQLAQRHLREMRADILAATPALRRPAVRLLLRVAAARLPLRGVGKRSFLHSLDVARAAARRIGALEQAAGRLGHVDDVFYLTFEELTGAWPPDARGLIAKRRARREAFLAVDLPATWRGDPELSAIGGDAGDEAVDMVQGVGVSAGVVEGPARVVSDPSFADVQPDEVLVARTTDPSWSSIMFVSSALVVDIGGALSHAAVVARELGLPCVVSTRTGTRAIRTGDRVRVDGAAGTVEILERAAPPG
jgi:pyruvate,water dikinase